MQNILLLWKINNNIIELVDRQLSLEFCFENIFYGNGPVICHERFTLQTKVATKVLRHFSRKSVQN